MRVEDIGNTLEEQDNLFKVGTHDLKNGWLLKVSEYEGSYKISKPSVYGICATRTTGGQWGDGIWSISILKSYATENYIPVSGGFDIETVNNIIAEMEALMVTYNITDYAKRGVFSHIIRRAKKVCGRVSSAVLLLLLALGILEEV